MNADGRADLQVLMDHPRGAGLVVSCYADTRVAEGFECRRRRHLKDEARRARGEMDGDPAAREELDRQLDLIARHLDRPARSVRGMAVFTAAGWDRALALDSDGPFEDRLVLDEEPYLVPFLVDQVLRPLYLTVLTDTRRGRIYAARTGSARLIEEVRGDVPGQGRPAGERGGKEPATTDRHREDRILHHFKQLADRVEAAWDERPHRGIILLGEHEVLEDFLDALPHRLARRVVAEAPHAWSGEPPAIDDRVREIATAIAVAEQRRLLDQVDNRLREGYAVTTGPREVIEALSDGRVRALIVGPDPGEVARRCRGCRSLFTAGESSCPYCKSPCDRTNLWQEILIRALRHGVDIHFVAPEAGRAVPGQIAALLLRDEPGGEADPTAAAQHPRHQAGIPADPAD